MTVGREAARRGRRRGEMTVATIARLAGVSAPTVSKVLNGRPGVASGTRRRVFTLPAGQVITNGWNATYSPTSGTVTARNMGYNNMIPPSGSTSIGLQATHTGNTSRPASFTLNGVACAIG